MSISTNPNPRILIVGDPILDTYITGNVTRISPEAPIPILLAQDSYDKAGGAANVALNISAFTSNCTFVFPSSNSTQCQTLISLLNKTSLNLCPIYIKNFSTPHKTRFLSGSHHILRYDQESSVTFDSQSLISCCNDILNEIDLVILSDYNKGFVNNASSFIELCHALNIPCLVDPKSKDLSVYKYAFLLTPNLKEFSEAVGGFKDEQEFIDKAKLTVESLHLQFLVVTLAEDGAFVMDADYQYTYHRSSRVDVADVTGAGDIFLSILSYNLAINRDIHAAIASANLAAGLSVSRLGTVVITPEDLDQAKHSSNQFVVKHLSLNSFLSVLPPSPSRPKVVFTNGCFDVLHIGHVNYLKEAKSLADILVIGLNSDSSVSYLKGPTRPVNTYRDRAELLSALDFVDFIIPFDSPTPIELIESISPDYLVKGGDYLPSEIVGYNHVVSHGGTVLSLPFYSGYSSTNIIQKMSSDA